VDNTYRRRIIAVGVLWERRSASTIAARTPLTQGKKCLWDRNVAGTGLKIKRNFIRDGDQPLGRFDPPIKKREGSESPSLVDV
jgi:hypothetical protein